MSILVATIFAAALQDPASEAAAAAMEAQRRAPGVCEALAAAGARLDFEQKLSAALVLDDKNESAGLIRLAVDPKLDTNGHAVAAAQAQRREDEADGLRKLSRDQEDLRHDLELAAAYQCAAAPSR